MTDRPILFSAPMVRALIAGTQTQTRRILNPQPYPLEGRLGFWNASGAVGGRICISDRALLDLHRKAKPGDRLYVREAWRVSQKWDETPPRDLPPRTMTIFCEAGGSIANQKSGKWEPDNDYPPSRPDWVGKFRQAMHMPRWASRITLIVESVKVERLQDISKADALAEGIEQHGRFYGVADAEWDEAELSAIMAYRRLWNRINGVDAWGANPWVVAYTFRRIMGNIDAIAEAA